MLTWQNHRLYPAWPIRAHRLLWHDHYLKVFDQEDVVKGNNNSGPIIQDVKISVKIVWRITTRKCAERSFFLKKKKEAPFFPGGFLKCHSKVPFVLGKIMDRHFSTQILKELWAPRRGPGQVPQWPGGSFGWSGPKLVVRRCWVFFVSKKQFSSVTLMVLGIGPRLNSAGS